MKTYRKYGKLSNGHYLAMFITRRKKDNLNFSWIVAACIYETKRMCNYWFRHQERALTKGENTWGMEGLLKALSWLKELEQAIPKGDSIVIYWIDERRYRAFKYLKRYGYIEGIYLNRPCFILEKQ